MDEAAHDDSGIFEATAFLGHFDGLTDGRQPGKVVYPLDEVLLLALLAGAGTFTDIARSGEKKLPLLRAAAFPAVRCGVSGCSRTARRRTTGSALLSAVIENAKQSTAHSGATAAELQGVALEHSGQAQNLRLASDAYLVKA